MNERIAVFDETGSNRPQDSTDQDFGVAAIIFPKSEQGRLSKASKSISELLRKKDYKFRHVQVHDEARRLFLDTLNSSTKTTQVYGFYSANQSIANETRRGDQAAAHYYPEGNSGADGSNFDTKGLLSSFIQYASVQVAAHALTNDYRVDVYWDRRNDIDIIESEWNEQLQLSKNVPAYRRIDTAAKFCGTAGGELSAITRLAGVVAGDIRQFFRSCGSPVWNCLDEGGLRGDVDPIMLNLAMWDKSMPVIESFNTPITDHIPDKAAADTTMLGGYYKKLLRHDQSKRYLLSFGSPSGQLGIINLEHKSCWHVQQLPD